MSHHQHDPGQKDLSPAGALRAALKRYDAPQAIVDDTALSHDDKVALLRIWEYDARELSVASEEGMNHPGQGNDLTDVTAALHALGETASSISGPPFKQGG
ncbi:hypothetical protein [Yunchengibacter salinarum]|uniref:hypothetical protein n=1 Tax=Yunchengibacter salinarum TaxID=3133399 RepID=UPI0035B5FA39